MKITNQTIIVGIIALLIGGVGGYTVADRDMSYGQRHDGKMSENSPMGMHRMHDNTMMDNDDPDMGSMSQMDHMMAMMVDSEREFIEGMIPHHQEAVDTAKEVIARGGSTPEIKKLVENIVVAQEVEIAEMKNWYEEWFGEKYADNGKYMPMMRELKNLSGAQLDQVFLEDMIGHHMGAIMMAHSVEPYITHNEITELTEAIISSQSAEIAQMRKMLQGL
ncbi:DUF305 domain-containing protein [Candidatus Kaiserbacteria bacterium]|nr:MAG: DUF305 domain-containing protein [Candidatus Kaiserbacteria bacterium]